MRGFSCAGVIRQSHEKASGLPVGILLAVRDEAPALGQKLADRSNDADAVGADERQHPGRYNRIVQQRLRQ
jgi:hypothetical protein